MPRPTIEDIRALPPKATLYQWILDFVRFPSAVQAPPRGSINMRCVSAAIPAASVGKMSTTIRGHTTHQPGPLSYDGSIALGLVETVDNTVQRLITRWREACCQTRTGIHQPKDEVSGTISLTRLDVSDRPIWRYVLYGCFLESYSLGELGADSANMTPSITLSYDFFEDQEL